MRWTFSIVYALSDLAEAVDGKQKGLMMVAACCFYMIAMALAWTTVSLMSTFPQEKRGMLQ